MKLTPLSRILIALLIVGGLFFLIRGFLASPEGSPTGADTPAEEMSETTAPGEDVAPAPVAERGTTRTFNYIPPAPQAGKLKGVVELGASGFNSFIIRVDDQKNWQLDSAEYGASLVYENMATEGDVRDGLKRYIARMLDYGVGGRDIHFVVSSSARETEQVQKISAGLKSLGYVVNTVNAEEEGKHALRAVLPDEYEDSAFVVDIGSGNTKISWMDGGRLVSVETYGSKYYQDNLTDDQVYQKVKELAGRIPAGRTQTCFIIGGVPFELAKQVRTGDERYTVLKAPQQYQANGEKQKSGLTIYRAIADATGCDTFVFDWDANFTIGFLLSL